MNCWKTCINSSENKYKGNEPSPKGLGFCASGEYIGVAKTGNDGKKWKVVSTKNNINRWVRDKHNIVQGKIYMTSGNAGGYAVNNSVPLSIVDVNTDRTVKRITHPEKVFIARGDVTKKRNILKHYAKYDGNAILVNHKNKKYTYVGDTVYTFTSLSKIVHFVSYVHNGIYAYAIDDKKRVYLMNDCVILSNAPFNIGPYHYYYRNTQIPVDVLEDAADNDMRNELYYTTDLKESYVNDFVDEFVEPFTLILDGKRQKFTFAVYKKIVQQYGQAKGFLKLKTITDHIQS
jgi:hypothetical protein